MNYEVIPFPHKRRSSPLSPDLAARIKALLELGLSQQDIATITGVNQGRVSQVNTGMRYPGIEPSQGDLFH